MSDRSFRVDSASGYISLNIVFFSFRDASKEFHNVQNTKKLLVSEFQAEKIVSVTRVLTLIVRL